MGPDSSSSAADGADPDRAAPDETSITDLAAVVRRVVAHRVREPHLVDDVVQETLARVLKAAPRIEGDSLAPYAVVTARNVIATLGSNNRRAQEKVHLLADLHAAPSADEALLRQDAAARVQEALSLLPPAERDVLLRHEVAGESTADIAAATGISAGAVAAQLHRIRAKLRVEYLLLEGGIEPPTDRCRPVLRAVSLSDRRRQADLDARGHLLACACCRAVATRLEERETRRAETPSIRIEITRDADVVQARQHGRLEAARAGLSGTDLTLVATAISEVARNIVKFADRGEITVEQAVEGDRRGVRVVARDVGPGIPDVALALRDGFSTYGGLGLGLPGCRRLMDEFEIVSEAGTGTTVTMTKWR